MERRGTSHKQPCETAGLIFFFVLRVSPVSTRWATRTLQETKLLQRWFSSRCLPLAGEPAEGGRARSAQESGAAEERDPGKGAGTARTGEPPQYMPSRAPKSGGHRKREEAETEPNLRWYQPAIWRGIRSSREGNSLAASRLWSLECPPRPVLAEPAGNYVTHIFKI